MFSKKYLLRGAAALLQPQHQAASKVNTLRALFTAHKRVMLPKQPIYHSAMRPFTTVSPEDFASGSSQKRITTRTLCEITGTKYYLHNQEIGYSMERKVKVYDENDVLMGELTFGEALASAQSGKKDLVLRNDKSEPPVCKIMLYKMELLKKLFKKLGKQQTEEKEQKSKTIRLTTTIAMHDLENKKRKAIEYLKQISNLKFYMKVNIYDEENV